MDEIQAGDIAVWVDVAPSRYHAYCVQILSGDIIEEGNSRYLPAAAAMGGISSYPVKLRTRNRSWSSLGVPHLSAANKTQILLDGEEAEYFLRLVGLAQR